MRNGVTIFLTTLLLSAAGAEPAPSPSAPLWDGRETIAEYARRANLPSTKTLELGNGIPLELVLIPAGTFRMGTPEPTPVDETPFQSRILMGQAVLALGGGWLVTLLGIVLAQAFRGGHRPQYSLARFLTMTVAAGIGLLGALHWWYSARELAQARSAYRAALARYSCVADTEKPDHWVTLRQAFYVGKYEVTQEQYQQVMADNPSRNRGRDLPVDSIGWLHAKAFCKKASESTGVTVRLLTEAEWEYTCRAGTQTMYSSGDEDKDLDGVAWYDGNSGMVTHPVGQKHANAWGVYDMHGNVDEWCEDELHDDYNGAPDDGRAWANAETPRGEVHAARLDQDALRDSNAVNTPLRDKHVVRGGSMDDGAKRCRAAYRRGYDFPYVSFGFRVAVPVGPHPSP